MISSCLSKDDCLIQWDMREFFTQVKIRDWDGSASQKVVGDQGPTSGALVFWFRFSCFVK